MPHTRTELPTCKRPGRREHQAHSPAAGRLGLKHPGPPLRSLPTTGFTNTAPRSAGWCGVGRCLASEVVLPSPEAPGPAGSGNETTKTFPRADGAAAPLGPAAARGLSAPAETHPPAPGGAPAASHEGLTPTPLLSPQPIFTPCNAGQLNFTALLFIDEHLFLVPTLEDLLSVLYPIESSVKLH